MRFRAAPPGHADDVAVARDDTTFGKGDPVLAYWLAHSEGFRVRGRRSRGVVARVVLEPPGRVTALALRTRLGRRRVVAAEAVEAVVPAEGLLVLERRHRRHRLAAGGKRAGAIAAAGGRLAAVNAVVLGRSARPYLAAAARAAVVTAVVLERIAQPYVLAAVHEGARRTRLWLGKLADGDAVGRWIGRGMEATAVIAAAGRRSATSRCSSCAAVAASGARRAAATTARAARSSRRSSSS